MIRATSPNHDGVWGQIDIALHSDEKGAQAFTEAKGLLPFALSHLDESLLDLIGRNGKADRVGRRICLDIYG